MLWHQSLDGLVSAVASADATAVTSADASAVTWPLLVLAGVLGASVGSFLNVCIARWPAGLSVLRPRSRCPQCARPIPAFENIPVVSWLLLRGRCRGCAVAISPQYPLVELLVAVGWMLSLQTFGVRAESVRVAVFGTTLLGIAITDAKHYLIPDGFTVFGLSVVLLAAIATVFFPEPTHFASVWPAVMGACVGAGAITLIGWLAEVIMRREAMGFGDVTLMAVVGAAVGPERALLTIISGAAMGAVTFLLCVAPVVWLRSRRRGVPFAIPDVPFGVFLAPAALLALLWGDAALTWYLQWMLPT